jgi:hypothetical protein
MSDKFRGSSIVRLIRLLLIKHGFAEHEADAVIEKLRSELTPITARTDRARAHAGAASTSAPLGLSLLVPARSATRPKTIAHTGYRNYSPSADINWVAIDVSHTRADLEVIA